MLIFPRNGGGFHLKLYFLASKGYYTAKKQRQNLRRRCPGGIPGRKRYHFLRGMGYHPLAEQKNTPKPAQKVSRRDSGQKKVSFPARNGIPPASRAEREFFIPIYIRCNNYTLTKTIRFINIPLCYEFEKMQLF